MSNNKRPPKELAKYVIEVTEKTKAHTRQTFLYGKTQKDLRERSKDLPGVKRLFLVSYDYYGEVK